jgi:hypothetical protein
MVPNAHARPPPLPQKLCPPSGTNPRTAPHHLSLTASLSMTCGYAGIDVVGSQTLQFTNLANRPPKTRRFRSRINLRSPLRKTNLPSRNPLVPRPRTPPRLSPLRPRNRHLGLWVHLRRTHAPNTLPPRRLGRLPTRHVFPRPRHAL